MNQDELTFHEAVKILEITDFQNLKQEDLVKLRKKAKKRWHPDTIAHMNPSQEAVKKYERNFRLVDVAIEYISGYLKGEINPNDSYSPDSKIPPQEAPEDIQRRNAPNMQNVLSQVWINIKQQGYKRTNDKNMIYEGNTIKEALKSDLEDMIPEMCVIAFFSGLCLIFITFCITYIFGGFIVTENVPQLSNFLSNAAQVIFIILLNLHMLSCFVAALPGSRFWLPNILGLFVGSFVDIGYKFYTIFYPFIRIGSPLGIIMTILFITTKVFIFLILRPIYFTIGEIIGEYKIGKLYQKGTYYAGLADWYIEKLLKADTSNMDSVQLNDLTFFYGEMKEIWENQGY